MTNSLPVELDEVWIAVRRPCAVTSRYRRQKSVLRNKGVRMIERCSRSDRKGLVGSDCEKSCKGVE